MEETHDEKVFPITRPDDGVVSGTVGGKCHCYGGCSSGSNHASGIGRGWGGQSSFLVEKTHDGTDGDRDNNLGNQEGYVKHNFTDLPSTSHILSFGQTIFTFTNRS